MNLCEKIDKKTKEKEKKKIINEPSPMLAFINSVDSFISKISDNTSEIFKDTSNSTFKTDPGCIPFFKEKAGKISDKEIAKHLWLNSEVIISEDMVKKVNKVAIYLKEQGFELRGIKADGNCFCSAFLESYNVFSRVIPILDKPKESNFLFERGDCQ